MPSLIHEAIVELFRQRPVLAAELLQESLLVPIPRFTSVRIESANFTDLTPPEYRADLVVLLANDQPVLGIIVEVQLRIDDAKVYSWPHYATSLRVRLSCPTCVLVYTLDDRVARWAATPVSCGPGWTFAPVVIGPALVPVVEDIEQARARPELALLSVLAHGKRVTPARGVQMGNTALKATENLSDEARKLYYDLILNALSVAARKEFEDMYLKNHEYVSDFARKYVAEGKAEGKAEGRLEGEAIAVLRVLEARGIAVDETARQRILACTDQATLDQWLKRAVMAATAAEVVASGS